MARRYPRSLKWWLAGAYLALVFASAVTATDLAHAAIWVYRLALPLSVFSYGAAPALGWPILVLATATNAALLYVIGASLASRSAR